jgi:two-component system LytT family response regulator
MVRSLRPDAVFLDVQLPVLDGLQVLSAIDYEPYVVFTTAYEAHAVTAFQLGALDYLLKPFTDERFHDAVARINKAMTSAPADPDPHAGAATSVAHRAGIVLRSEGYISRLFVRERDTVRPVLVAQIERAEADGDYTALIVAGRRRLAYISLNDLNASLDPTQFLRIHRSHLVNLDFVVDMQWYDGTRLQIQMRDGTKVLASRTRSRDLRKLIV